MKNPKKVYAGILHISLWLVLITLSFLLVKDLPFRFKPQFFLLNILLAACIFYVTYFFIMPLLFKNRITVFFLASILVLGFSVFVKHQLNPHRFNRSNFEQTYNNGNREPAEFTHKLFRPYPKPKGKGIPRSAIFGSFGVVLFYGLGFSVRLLEKWQADQKHQSEMEKNTIQTELAFLKQQINPHFLFNSLNSIYSLSLANNEAASDSILKLSSILRYLLYQSEKKVIKIEDELIVLRDYIDLQRLRLTQMVDLKLTISGNGGNSKIEPFIILPVVENAFKYGVDTVNPCFIHLEVVSEPGQLILKTTNTIIPSVKSNADKGIGLKNLQRRLELLYPERHQLLTSAQNDIYTVYLELKLTT